MTNISQIQSDMSRLRSSNTTHRESSILSQHSHSNSLGRGDCCSVHVVVAHSKDQGTWQARWRWHSDLGLLWWSSVHISPAIVKWCNKSPHIDDNPATPPPPHFFGLTSNASLDTAPGGKGFCHVRGFGTGLTPVKTRPGAYGPAGWASLPWEGSWQWGRQASG